MGYPATGKSAAAEWVCLPEVSSALAEISQLKMINAEVIEAVHPPGGLTDAHMYELLSLSADAAAKSTCTKDQGVILARWLLAAEHDVHFDGLPYLPDHKTCQTRALLERCKRARKKYTEATRQALDNARQQQGRGNAAGAARWSAQLQSLEEEAAQRPFRVGGGGGEPAPHGAGQQVQVPSAASLLAFAMGTHARLGAASPVKRLDTDALGLIAAAVRGKQPPPPTEVLRLRRETARLLRWGQHEQRQKKAAQTQNSGMRTELERVGRREAAAVQATEENKQAYAINERVLRNEMKCEEEREAMERGRYKHDLEVAWQLKVNRTSKGYKQLLKTVQADAKKAVADAKKAVDDANQEAAKAWQAVAERDDQLDVLRGQRVNGLLEANTAQAAKIKQLGARRTLNSRRMSDANLDRRRAEVAREQAESAQRALGQYFVAAEAQRVNTSELEALEAELGTVRAQLAAAEAARDKYRAIAEPPPEKFFTKGHYTADVDLTALQVIAELGVAATAVSPLFKIFGDFFGVTIPSREREVQLSGAGAEGKRQYAKRKLLLIPGKTHMKELPAIGGVLHKIQVGEWLLEDDEASYCYVADGANSQQKEILAQLLFRRNKESGKLESRALSIDEISDKTSAGQKQKFKAALASIAEAWEEADALGLLRDVREEAAAAGGEAVHGAAAEGEAAEGEAAEGEAADAAGFHAQRRKALRAKLRAKIAGLRASSTMNDRAAPARKAARLARGGDGTGGEGDVVDDPTCAHHAVANVGEEGRKAIDKVLKAKMNITEEQCEADAAKVKALRTNVGWFSSPACSLIYQVCKYVALFSSKGYAIGENFAQWLAHKLHTTERLAGELIGHVQDLLAICGGRDYVFFLDTAVVERFSQLESLYGYLLEEADLGAEAGGKLRKAIIAGFESVYCMSAVRSMAVIADAWLWPMLRAIEPGDDVHILDVCPALWPRVLEWLEEAAASPQTAIDGKLCLRTRLEAAGLRTTARRGATPASRRRAERASADLERIRAKIAADAELQALVHEMLTAAFTAMAAGVRNHASEFLPGGCCCTAKITPELRRRLDGMPLTSVAAETMFARVKRRADRGGISRHDTRMGQVLCQRDGTVAWARSKEQAEGLLRLAARSWRKDSGKRTMEDERQLKGAAKEPERAAKLQKKRAGRSARAAELERLKGVALVESYSALTKMGNAELAEQLKIYKLLEKKTGFKTTGTGPEMRLQLQLLIFEKFGAAANDLKDGDSGVEGRGVRRRKVEGGGGGSGGGKKKGGKKRSRANIISLHGWEWEASEEFVIERLIGKMVADGGDVPGREGEKVPAGTVLYKVLWEGFPPEIATWEEEDQIPCGEVDFVEQYEASLAEEEAEEEAQAEESESDGE